MGNTRYLRMFLKNHLWQYEEAYRYNNYIRRMESYEYYKRYVNYKIEFE